MDKSKIEIKVGIVKFSGEGEEEWLGKQLDKVLEKVPELLKIELTTPQKIESVTGGESISVEEKSESEPAPTKKSPTNLVTFLREKNATSSQVNKFLVTAVFLQLNGTSRISTGDVSQSLRTSNQTKLSNPSDALNKNVTKGYCEKEDGKFFVSPEGLDFVNKLK